MGRLRRRGSRGRGIAGGLRCEMVVGGFAILTGDAKGGGCAAAGARVRERELANMPWDVAARGIGWRCRQTEAMDMREGYRGSIYAVFGPDAAGYQCVGICVRRIP
jgi:hypothetical protein